MQSLSVGRPEFALHIVKMKGAAPSFIVTTNRWIVDAVAEVAKVVVEEGETALLLYLASRGVGQQATAEARR